MRRTMSRLACAGAAPWTRATTCGTSSAASNPIFRRRSACLQRRRARCYRRTRQPQRSFSSFRHRAQRWFRQRRIGYKAEHTATGTNRRFLVTHLQGRSRLIFDFYNDRGECENWMVEFPNGFAADRRGTIALTA